MFVPLRLMAEIVPVKDFVPPKTCVPLVTSPLAVADASGRFRVSPDHAASVPEVPTLNVRFEDSATPLRVRVSGTYVVAADEIVRNDARSIVLKV